MRVLHFNEFDIFKSDGQFGNDTHTRREYVEPFKTGKILGLSVCMYAYSLPANI